MVKNIYINAAHTSYSPGGVWGARTEHSDVLKFARMLHMGLERDKSISVQMFTGDIRRRSFSEDDTVIVLHRASNEKNSFSYGARVTVPEEASSDIQYEAYRLLMSICGERLFRMKGVHTGSESHCRNSINTLGTNRVFLFDLGYIDSYTDNRIFDKCYEVMAERLSEKIKEILKEEKDEDNGTV